MLIVRLVLTVLSIQTAHDLISLMVGGGVDWVVFVLTAFGSLMNTAAAYGCIVL